MSFQSHSSKCMLLCSDLRPIIKDCPIMDFLSKTLNQDLISLVDQLSQQIELPLIKELILPKKNVAGESKYAKFGLLLLEDNSSGFFYRLADVHDNANQHLLTLLHQKADTLPGMKVTDVAQWFNDDDDINIGLGMAAINACSQHVLNSVGHQYSGIVESTGHVDRARECRHVGMVGYFAPVVKQLAELDIPLTVIELDQSLYRQQRNLTVTGDITQLAESDYIICTGSTLINHSLEKILSDFAQDRFFELIGPTCGCFADPLFARGVDQIGGSRVIDVSTTRSRIESGEPWGNSVSKFVIKPYGYPTFPDLLSRLMDKN